MSYSLELSHYRDGALSAVVIDRDGIIRATDFKPGAFDRKFGWFDEDLIGKQFVCIHAAHEICKRDLCDGVRKVCRGESRQFRFQFDIQSDDLVLTYELIADVDSSTSDNILLTYEKIKTRRVTGDQYAANSNIHEASYMHSPVGVMHQNNQGKIENINPAGQSILGLSQTELREVEPSKLASGWVDSDDLPLSYDCFPHVMALKTGEEQKDVVIGIRKSGNECTWVKASSEVIYDARSGKQTGVLTSFLDITEERNSIVALQAQSERAQMAMESAQIGVWDWVPGEKQMIWDRKLFQIYGFPDENTIGTLDAWKRIIHPSDVERVLREAENMMKTGRQKEIDYRVVWPNGSIRHMRSQARTVRDSKGNIVRAIGVTHDITNAVLAEKKLWELAYTDNLTGAYSRAGLNFRLSRTVARALARNGKFCVLMFGLSRFKEINENYSLSVGDKILTEVARRAQQLVHGDDTVARVGGDEFTLVLEGLSDESKIPRFIKQVRDRVLESLTLSEGLVIPLEAAIGIATFPEDGCDAAVLQTNASLAMRKNRMHDHAYFTPYTKEMSQEVSRKFNLKYQLFSAVKDGEFQLYYQPIIDLQHNKLIGCEALIRWKDNNGDFVPPLEFIPVVEESGLICELGRWINFTAIKQWKLWQQLVPDLGYISVNVSPRQLEQPDFVDELVSMVENYGILPENLQLEITEGTFLRESTNVDGKLHKLAFHGFRLAIDDFGTGYSSLAYLKRFSVDVIKIDRSFIKDIETDNSDRDIVSAILAMNKKLGFKTLVEGVETQKQNEIVQGLGCDSAQGYLYGRPTFADEFAEVYFRGDTCH